MQFAIQPISGERIDATKNAKALCPQCSKPVIAKCGAIVIHHWAHQAADCDSWWERESDWHRAWKSLVPDAQIEVTRGNHRADIVRSDGLVVELQHSTISPAEIGEREGFYGRMVWLFDGRSLDDNRLNLRITGRRATFRWKHPRKHYAYCKRPVYIDLGDDLILRMRKLYLNGAPYGGWGMLDTRQTFIDWLQA